MGQLFTETKESSFTGKILVAMPHLPDPRFFHAVIFVCGHDEKGAMGLIVNKPLTSITFTELLEQMAIEFTKGTPDITVHYGGPIEVGRGFVLHSSDYMSETTVEVQNGLALTATLDILRSISDNSGPSHSLLALGYVGWGAGQLEKEIQDNEWITIDASPDLVFNQDMEGKWLHALASIGVDPAILTLDSGHA